MSKLGKKDLFSPTVDKAVGSSTRGKTPSEDGDVEKVMVMLSPRQVHELDKLSLEIRQTTGIKVKRSMLIRSLIDGFLDTRLRYDEVRSPEDLHHIIAQAVHSR